MFYLSCTFGDHKGNLLWEVSGKLQEVNPKERCPDWEPLVSTEDQQGFQTSLVTGQEALGRKS